MTEDQRRAAAARSAACLCGLATGDAIGKQSETLSNADVRRWYPDGIRGFEGPPGTVIPRYIGNRKRQWQVGEITDDTERTLAVARALLADGFVSHESVGRELLLCTKCIHPGIRSLWEFHQAADPARMATAHDGCGGAIRVAPVGILYASQRLSDLVGAAREATIPTHGGSLAIAGAAATAAAVSAAIDGLTSSDVLNHAERAAAQAEERWPGPGGPAMANAIRTVHETLGLLPSRAPDEIAARCFPDHPLRIVPLALALAATMTSAADAILVAANVGGDSDSVASIAGGILGAQYPQTVNQAWSDVVMRINALDLTATAANLARLRH